MINQKLRVGIVLPHYNDEANLRKCIRAIINQTYSNWHLYLVDDGSLRQFWQFRPEVEIYNSQITTIYKSNGGVASARNIALNIIHWSDSFDLVAYCDSDDFWEPDYLEKQVAMLDVEGGPDMVYAQVDLRFPDGSIAIPFGIAPRQPIVDTQTLLKGNFIYISGVVRKVKCLYSVPQFDSALNSLEDWDFWIRMSIAGYSIHENPHARFTYTVKPDGNGSRRTDEIYQRLINKHRKYIHDKA